MATRTKAAAAEPRLERRATQQWIPLGRTRINPLAQREFVAARANALYAEFDPEQIGLPTANLRDGWWYIIDGQHRIEALKMWLGDGWEDQHVLVNAYEGMSEAEEADTFLKINNTMAVNAFSKFRIGVKAKRPDEAGVQKIVTNLGLRITTDRLADNGIMAAGSLLRVYRDLGPTVLARTLAVMHAAYGRTGLDAIPIRGMALLIARYDEAVEDDLLVKRLSEASGGIGAVLNKAERMRKETGNQKIHCVAAALVDTYNSKAPRGEKLVGWWKVN